MKSPLVSVILPVFNGEIFLREAINSVLNQSVAAELIVVDDGSTDRTAEIATAFGDRLRYLYKPNGGPASARNLGIQAATAPDLAFIDADDIWPPGKLQWQLSALNNKPAVGLVLGRVQAFQDLHIDGRAQRRYCDPFQIFLFGCAVLRRAVVEKVGTLDETLEQAEDLDWFVRLRESSVALECSETVALWYRLHKNSLTSGKNLVERNVLSVLKRSLQRRRLAAAMEDGASVSAIKTEQTAGSNAL